MVEILDPLKTKESFTNWKKNFDIDGVSDINKDLIIKYVSDMEKGINISTTSKRGRRSYSRLLSLRSRLKSIAQKLESNYKVNDLRQVTEDQLIDLFTKLRDGEILTTQNRKYKDVDSLAETFTSFWHWHTRTQRKNNIQVEDITKYLVKNGNSKPDWVYLSEPEFNKYINSAKWDYKVMFSFIYDAGIRAPKELFNTKVSDLDWDDDNKRYTLTIRDEVSKTFGRKIKLMVCSPLLRRYITEEKLERDDYIFSKAPNKANEYMKRLATRVFGKDTVSKGRKKYSQITMYDLRHCSACYWLPRYKSESALKYRFGWKSSKMVHYYSEFLNMKDTISEEDLLVDISVTEVQKSLENEKKQREILDERFTMQEKENQMLRQQLDDIKNKLESFKVESSVEKIEENTVNDSLKIIEKQNILEALMKADPSKLGKVVELMKIVNN